MKKISFIVTILVVVLIGMYAMKMNVYSNNDREQKAENEYYHELESRFEDVLRYELQKDGYGNCGITIRSIIYPGMGREYIVQIHHSEFVKMSEEERYIYLDDISKITFPDSTCNVKYEILL